MTVSSQHQLLSPETSGVLVNMAAFIVVTSMISVTLGVGWVAATGSVISLQPDSAAACDDDRDYRRAVIVRSPAIVDGVPVTEPSFVGITNNDSVVIDGPLGEATGEDGGAWNLERETPNVTEGAINEENITVEFDLDRRTDTMTGHVEMSFMSTGSEREIIHYCEWGETDAAT